MSDCCAALRGELSALRAEIANLRNINEDAIIHKAVRQSQASIIPQIPGIVNPIIFTNLNPFKVRLGKVESLSGQALDQARQSLEKAYSAGDTAKSAASGAASALAQVAALAAGLAAAGISIATLKILGGRLDAQEKRLDAHDTGLSKILTLFTPIKFKAEDAQKTASRAIQSSKDVGSTANKAIYKANDAANRATESLKTSTKAYNKANEALYETRVARAVLEAKTAEAKKQANDGLYIANRANLKAEEALRKAPIPGPRGLIGEPGKQGEPGKEGKPGPIGIPGKQGEPGREGAPGKQGEPGKEGAPGKQGEPGKEGAPGKQGEPGREGAPGKQGEPGKEGAPGKQGEPGREGAPGKQGEPGREGAPGKQGEPGREGAPGKQGEPGKEGAPGKQGEPGREGAPGKQGEPGKEGAPGKQGEPGKEGAPGKQGEPERIGFPGPIGIPGKQGEPGREGAPGKQGEPGKEGAPGKQGEPGREGAPGKQGEPGREGAPGKQGEPGRIGFPGPIGIPGKQGEPGREGVPGKQGERGFPGPIGPTGQPGRDGKDGKDEKMDPAIRAIIQQTYQRLLTIPKPLTYPETVKAGTEGVCEASKEDNCLSNLIQLNFRNYEQPKSKEISWAEIEVSTVSCELQNNKWQPKTNKLKVLALSTESGTEAFELIAQFEELAKISKELCLQKNKPDKQEEECCYAAVPDSWRIRPEGHRPQLVIQFGEELADGKIGPPMYVVTIPHYKGEKLVTSPLPKYKKGLWEGIFVLADNSKVTVFAANEEEASKIINASQLIIPPEYLNKAYYKGGRIHPKVNGRRTFPEITVVPKMAKYFSQGLYNTKPDWIVRF